MGALQLNERRGGKRLSKAVATICSRAGKVRDMDVLLEFAATLSGCDDEQCLLQLLAHLRAQRDKSVRKFHSMIEETRKQTSQDLKQFEHYLQKHSDNAAWHDSKQQAWEAETAENARESVRIFLDWPKLSEKNLHPFRLQVKQMINLLVLLEAPKKRLFHRLDVTKDAIGEWHDWTILAAIASKVLNHQSCPMRKDIDATVKRKLAQAVAVATLLRKQISSSNEVER